MINTYPPARQRGLVVHGILLGSSVITTITALVLIFSSRVGLGLTFSIILLIFGSICVPIFGYRVYGLVNSSYQLDRNALRIGWGLRQERIPVSDIEWVKHISAFNGDLRLPIIRIPGGILGEVKDRNIGKIEYIADEVDSLVIVGTARKAFGVSPEDVNGFMQTFNRIFELGSLEIGEANSQYVSFAIVSAWNSIYNRFIWVFNLVLNLAFFFWVSIIAPGYATVSLGFVSTTRTPNIVPGTQLILLPVVSMLLSLFGFFLGLVLYQESRHYVLAKIIWLSNVLTTFLFLLSLLFILPTGT